ncbi:MAG TPA: HD domain-containing protein [Longimicrobiaceae bacterium]|nr:HD domain-containing protein [Longimicrobiaceae bacterium]
MEPDRAGEVLRFLHVAGRLKETARTGWALRGIDSPESVADHSFRVCLLALVLSRGAEPPLDRERCLAMALVHDLAESLVGDITPYDGVPVEEKHRREREAMERLCAMLGDDEVLRLWEEYQAAETREARFVKDLDKLETVLQAAEYEEARGIGLAEFREMGAGRDWLPATRPVHQALRRADGGPPAG